MSLREKNSKDGFAFEKCFVDFANHVKTYSKPIVEDARTAFYDLQEKIKFKDTKLIGDKTKNQLGDVLLDDNVSLELKYVNSGNGTYHNTTINYWHYVFGLPLYIDFLDKEGYFDYLDSLNLGEDLQYNKNNSSPFNVKQSKIIRHNMESVYNLITKAEIPIRKKYTDEICLKLLEKNNLQTLVYDMIYKVKFTKNATKEHKGIPNNVLVFNRSTNSCSFQEREDIMKYIKKNNFNFKKTMNGLIIDNKITLQNGWQNGTGLNNPTIRVFINYD